MPAMLRNWALPPEAFWGGPLFPGAPGAHSALGPGQARGGGSDRDAYEGVRLPLSSGRTGAGLRPGSSGRCPLPSLSCCLERAVSAFFALGAGLCFPSQFPACALFRRSGKERGSSPGASLCDAPPCRAGMALRGRWCCRRDNFRGTPFPGAPGCARSQAAGLRILRLPRGAGCGTLWRGVGALGRWPEPRVSGIRGSVSRL